MNRKLYKNVKIKAGLRSNRQYGSLLGHFHGSSEAGEFVGPFAPRDPARIDDALEVNEHVQAFHDQPAQQVDDDVEGQWPVLFTNNEQTIIINKRL